MRQKAINFLRGRAFSTGTWLADWARDPDAFGKRRYNWDRDHFRTLNRWRRDGFLPRSILDLGGNEGCWSEMVECLYKPKSIIIFEPQPNCLKGIRAKANALKVDWDVRQVAVGEGDGSLELHITENQTAASLLKPNSGSTPKEFMVGTTEVLRVPVRSLDSMHTEGILNPCALVKMDIQGYEAQVLRGGKRYLQKSERLVIEVSLRPIYEGQALIAEIIAICDDLGFRIEDMTEASRSWPESVLWQVDLWMTRK